jgi:V/A-type H+-transporting ATPase subunit I
MQRQQVATEQIAELAVAHQQLAAVWREPLPAAWQRAHACRILADTINRFPLQGQVYLIAGWTPVSALSRLTATVQEASEKRAIIEILEPDEARIQVPTLLHNPPIFAAFEGLVTTFGFPAYNELDPTVLFGLTFVLMYGMMFGDIGHGLLLGLAGLWLLRRNDGIGQLAPVLITAGASATLFGALYGTVLGMPLIPPIWARPLDNMVALLLAAVVAGVVVLNLGFALQIFIARQTRDWAKLLLDKNGLAGFWLYWTLLGGGLAIWQGYLSINLWLLLILMPTLLLFSNGPLTRLLNGQRPLVVGGWGEYSVLAFFELFEAFIGYAGNSLSFVRLGAFAVAHEGLSQVVLLLAGPTGSLSWLLVLALGTLIIVGFEGLIVGIQTLRLEYYEFFGKFFRGDGRPFTPLRITELS